MRKIKINRLRRLTIKPEDVRPMTNGQSLVRVCPIARAASRQWKRSVRVSYAPGVFPLITETRVNANGAIREYITTDPLGRMIMDLYARSKYGYDQQALEELKAKLPVTLAFERFEPRCESLTYNDLERRG